MNTEERLMQIKQSIESAKKNKATYEGKLAVQMDRLKDLGCKSIEDAEKRLKKLQTEIDALEEEVETSMKKFEEEYGF